MKKALLLTGVFAVIGTGIMTLLEYYFGTAKVFIGCLIAMPFEFIWCVLTGRTTK